MYIPTHIEIGDIYETIIAEKSLAIPEIMK